MSNYEQILYAVKDRVATVAFNRPDRMNAWTATMEKEVRDAIGKAAKDDGVRAIVLTGEGRAFCAGADMEGLGARAQDPKLASGLHEQKKTADNFDQRYSYLLAVPKPIIAGINGPVAGIGLVLTLYCDLRYIAEGTKLATAFARRGLICEYGSAWMLPRLVGTMNALDLMLSGRTMTAEEAATMGLARLLPAAGFRDAVHGIAKDFAELSSPRSMRIMKHQIYQAYFQTLAEATQLANEELVKCFGTDDLKEGVAHFVEKRKPNFTAR
jgi:enoyl-CoA hydratase/carnithine racemase